MEENNVFWNIVEIISPNNCLQPREEATYSYPGYTTDPYKGFCTAHGAYTNEGLYLPFQWCLADFPTHTSEMLPKGTPGIQETEMRLKSNCFCHIPFRTNRPSLQTCIHCKSVYVGTALATTRHLARSEATVYDTVFENTLVTRFPKLGAKV